MAPAVSILITGSEVLDGRVLDTNSNFICSKLNELGIVVAHVLSCTDDVAAIVRSLAFLSDSEFIIVSGGLGPTSDDLTRDAIAQFIGEPLVEDVEALAKLRAFYADRRRSMSPINQRQALIPQNASIVPNARGTAPGFRAQKQRVSGGTLTIFSLPGVPHELKGMLTDTVIPHLSVMSARTRVARSALKIFGLPESEVGQRIEKLALSLIHI